MIRLLLVLFTLVGFLIFSYPFLVAQVSLGKKDPHARDLESPWTSLKSKNIPQKTCPGIWAVFSGDFCL